MTTPFKTNGSGILKVVTTGQAIAFPAGINVNRLDIQALKTNTNDVIIGDNTTTNLQTGGGIALSNTGDVYNLELLSDMSKIYLNGTAGDGVSYNWYIGDRN